ncbi:MAG: hypothetical protein ABI746_07170 [Dermatophilaceae bacterium]
MPGREETIHQAVPVDVAHRADHEARLRGEHGRTVVDVGVVVDGLDVSEGGELDLVLAVVVADREDPLGGEHGESGRPRVRTGRQIEDSLARLELLREVGHRGSRADVTVILEAAVAMSPRRSPT